MVSPIYFETVQTAYQVFKLSSSLLDNPVLTV